MSREYIQIKGLSTNINKIFSKYYSITSPMTFMLPYSKGMEEIINELQEILPTIYSIGSSDYVIRTYDYIIKNDYIVLTLVQ